MGEGKIVVGMVKRNKTQRSEKKIKGENMKPIKKKEDGD